MRILCIIFTKKLKIILKSKGFYKTMVKQNSICTVPFSLINLIFSVSLDFFLINKMFFIPRQKTPHTISLLDTLTHTHTHTHTHTDNCLEENTPEYTEYWLNYE